MDIKYINQMVRERKRKRGLKHTPTYNYKKSWVSNSPDYLLTLNSYGLLGNSLNKPLKIGGVLIK